MVWLPGIRLMEIPLICLVMIGMQPLLIVTVMFRQKLVKCRIVGSSSGVNGHISLPYISSLASSNHTFAFWVLEESMLHYHGEDYLVYGQLERISNRRGEVAFPFSTSTDYISRY